MKQLLLDLESAPEPSFENLLPGDNGVVIEVMRTLKLGQTLYVWGEPGCGCTHLLKAFAGAHEGQYLHAVKDARLLHQLAAEDSPTSRALAIDDIHLASEETQGAVFRLYNLWRERGSGEQGFALAVSGDVAPLQMPCREDLRTRLGWGGVYRLMPLSDEEKMAALSAYAQARDIPLRQDLLRWLLTHGSRDIRVLFDCVSALNEYSLSTHRAITLPLLKTMLAEKKSECP